MYIYASQINIRIVNIKIRNIKIRNIKIRNIKIRSIKIRNIKIRNNKIRNIKIRNIKIRIIMYTSNFTYMYARGEPGYNQKCQNNPRLKFRKRNHSQVLIAIYTQPTKFVLIYKIAKICFNVCMHLTK